MTTAAYQHVAETHANAVLASAKMLAGTLQRQPGPVDPRPVLTSLIAAFSVLRICTKTLREKSLAGIRRDDMGVVGSHLDHAQRVTGYVRDGRPGS
jgi:hypothetical protein